ncbi:TetR family transcriptional regulator [Roseixanthobacter glucoisosaccharinicivorans]|uniref:TetR family transcriptional regulator n=1 Tax=Roseixanthobacter glucoisosaccharinicivorans TaxID=3119923 RepID=UPI00372C4864
MDRQSSGERVAQKQRTRAALLAAARRLLADGGTPTVGEAADAAAISRATAYRYFSTPEALAQEALLDAIAEEVDGVMLDAGLRALPPARQAEEVVASVLAMVLRHEALFRTYLSLAAAGQGTSRGGRRVRWISEALSGIAATMAPEAFTRLVNALSLLAGIETLVVLKDICGLDTAQVEATVRWIARTLVAGSLNAATT